MLKPLLALMCDVCALVLASAWTPAAQTPVTAAPICSGSGELARPPDYREWVFVTSGLGMTYGPAEAAAGRAPMFDNVFVTQAAYREFLRSGTWPDRTMLILEIRRAEASVSINNAGRTQGEIVALEAAVKDERRFPEGGWGYFSFSGRQGLVDSAASLAPDGVVPYLPQEQHRGGEHVRAVLSDAVRGCKLWHGQGHTTPPEAVGGNQRRERDMRTPCTACSPGRSGLPPRRRRTPRTIRDGHA